MAWKYVTDDDVAEMGEFCRHHLANHASLPPGSLFHYTTGAGLIAIVGSGQLWSTQIGCLNDEKEYIYAVEQLQQRFRQKLAANPPAPFRALFEKIDDRLGNPRPEIAGVFNTPGINFDAMSLTDAEQLRAARSMIGLTQAELAQQSGVSLPTIKRLELGQGLLPVRLATLLKLQRAPRGRWRRVHCRRERRWTRAETQNESRANSSCRHMIQPAPDTSMATMRKGCDLPLAHLGLALGQGSRGLQAPALPGGDRRFLRVAEARGRRQAAASDRHA
jgi:DNA-binding XRE family transcriptional regulator